MRHGENLFPPSDLSPSPFISPFQLARIPPVHFGPGKRLVLPRLAQSFGRRALLVRGSRSLEHSGQLALLRRDFEALKIDLVEISLAGEPTTAWIDSTRDGLLQEGIQVVIGLGGGSVIDAAKALSAMLPYRHSARDHLEDVGMGIPHPGGKIPFIAAPTTSGTGGEMTKNAVLSDMGPQGYKKSLRHDNLIPDAVVIDPELMLTCPRAVTAACGMDAFTQLLEPFLSPQATPLTDALAWSGLMALVPHLTLACGTGAGDVGVRGAMAYASMLSGVVLANAGLGVVHGLASPLGGYFPIPHGVVCGTLVAEATAANISALRQNRGENSAASLEKFARVATLFGEDARQNPETLGEALIAHLQAWTRELDMPRLGQYGVTPEALPRIIAGASQRNNPVALSETEMAQILSARL